MSGLFVLTGACNNTLRVGRPCPFCGCEQRLAAEFYGYLLTMCTSCGEELPAVELGEADDG